MDKSLGLSPSVPLIYLGPTGIKESDEPVEKLKKFSLFAHLAELFEFLNVSLFY